MAEEPHILGLALGGGAFRGTAHLGVLKALEEEGLTPGFCAEQALEQWPPHFTDLVWLLKISAILPVIYVG